jgi:hypothetical protein
MPEEVQLDNGHPWGEQGDLPPALVMWLIGLGVVVRHIPPRRPQHNGVIERSQGTNKRWAEPNKCDTPEQLQRHSDAADRRQRERYPYQDGKSRLEVHPGLRHSGRAYSEAWEQQHFSLEKVQARLAECVLPRRVDKVGRVYLYNREYYVGRRWAAQTVYARYDPQGKRWLFSDADNALLIHHPAPEISRERLRDLTSTNGRLHPR